MQKHGSAKIGALFGPITFLWFVAIALLGLGEISRAPAIFAALSPHYGAAFFLHFDPQKSSFFLGGETILATKVSGRGRWRQARFAWMSQNARDATSFFNLPPNRVVDLGSRIEI